METMDKKYRRRLELNSKGDTQQETSNDAIPQTLNNYEHVMIRRF